MNESGPYLCFSQFTEIRHGPNVEFDPISSTIQCYTPNQQDENHHDRECGGEIHSLWRQRPPG